MEKKPVFFSFFGYFSYSKYVGTFSVFYNKFNNRITNIIRKRVVGDILRDITATYNVWKKGIQNLSSVVIIWNNFIFFY